MKKVSQRGENEGTFLVAFFLGHPILTWIQLCYKICQLMETKIASQILGVLGIYSYPTVYSNVQPDQNNFGFCLACTCSERDYEITISVCMAYVWCYVSIWLKFGIKIGVN